MSSPIYANNINNTKKERTILLPPPGGPNVIQITLNRKVYGYGYYNVDGTVVVFDSSFTKALGPEDSQKLGNGGENIAIYDDGTQLSIDGLPNPKNGDSINIEMWQIDNDSSYKLIVDATQFTILSSGVKGYVLDRFLSKITPLNADSNVISFTPLTSNSATYLLRYTIFFNTPNIHLLNLNGCNQYLYKGITYTNSTTLRDTVKSTKWGYDSIYNITNINITPITAITNNINLFGCNSYVYKGITYTTSKIVRDTLKSVQGCDSIYNVANISILPILAVTNNIQLSGCNSVVYKSLTYSVSSTVRDTIKSTQGCDSIYNIANIVITPINALTKNISFSGCNTFVYKGITYTNSTIVMDTVKSAQGCDSVYNIANIAISPIVAFTNNLHFSACNSYTYKGITYANSTIVRDTVKSVQGCDSVYNVANIAITPIVAVSNNLHFSTCNSYTYKGITYSNSTIVRDTVKSMQGCDSVYNFANIAITPIVAITNNLHFSACNSYTYKGITYINSAIVRDTVKSVQGCDSVYNVANIAIKTIVAVTNNFHFTACNSYTYKGITYYNSSIVSDTVKSEQGCDSVYNITNIAITPIIAITHTIPLTGCRNYLYNGIVYSSSTTHIDTIKSVQGCDSIYTVANIVITTPTTPTVTIGSTSIIANGSSVVFTATAVNVGISPIYTFKVNSSLVQFGSSNTYSSSTLHVGDSISCTIISHANCVTDTIAKSNTIVMITNVPLVLLGFEAVLNGSITYCTWQTTAEVNTDYFLLQRSENGNTFSTINTTKANGTATGESKYRFVDVLDKDINNLSAVYYRLQMVDKDGHFTFSNLVKVNLTSRSEWTIYPNPAKDVVYVYGENINCIQITSIDGKMLRFRNKLYSNIIKVDISNLNKGIYFINILSNSGFNQVNKLVIE